MTQCGTRLINFGDLTDWFGRVRGPGPVMDAEHQFEFLVWSEGEDVPGLAEYDQLFLAAHHGLRWIEINPCPDTTVGLHFCGRMEAFRDVAKTVRSAVTIHGDGIVMVARLLELRSEIDLYAEAIDRVEP
jgi:hypothetical protein